MTKTQVLSLCTTLLVSASAFAHPDAPLNHSVHYTVYTSPDKGAKPSGGAIHKIVSVSADMKEKVEDLIFIYQAADGTWVNEIDNQHWALQADGTYLGTVACVNNACPQAASTSPAPTKSETLTLNVAPFGCLSILHRSYDFPPTGTEGPDHYEIWSVPRLISAGANQTMSTVHVRQEDHQYTKADPTRLESYYRGEAVQVVDPDGKTYALTIDMDPSRCAAPAPAAK